MWYTNHFRMMYCFLFLSCWFLVTTRRHANDAKNKSIVLNKQWHIKCNLKKPRCYAISRDIKVRRSSGCCIGSKWRLRIIITFFLFVLFYEILNIQIIIGDGMMMMMLKSQIKGDGTI